MAMEQLEQSRLAETGLREQNAGVLELSQVSECLGSWIDGRQAGV